MKPAAVLIASFQVPVLSDDHKRILKELLARYAKVVVVLRVAPVKGSRVNPFDFSTREAMLKAAYPSLVVLSLRDHPSASVWSRHLEHLLEERFPGEPYRLCAAPDSAPSFYTGTLPVEVWSSEEYSVPADPCAEEKGSLPRSEDFRRGVQYAYCQVYPKATPTVDVALLDGGRVLLGRKPEREGWRLPGGFVDPTDDGYEAAAVRELEEECGAVQTGSMRYLGSARIDDWRYRGEVDRVLTLLFATEFLSGVPQAGDDLAEVAWFEVAELEAMMAAGQIAEEHHVLIRLLLQSEVVGQK